MVQKKGKISKKESNKVKKGKCTLNKICRPWLLKSVDQKAGQTDQFSLNDQLYDCFVCDESRGLLVYFFIFILLGTPRVVVQLSAIVKSVSVIAVVMVGPWGVG